MAPRWVRRLVAPLAWVSLALAACGGAPPAAFPGRPEVAKAEVGWCDMLLKAKLTPPEAVDACKAAIPTASAAFLRNMTKCFGQRLASYGEEAPDKGAIVADCKEETQISLAEDQAGSAEVIGARCDRMLRCEKVAVGDCKAALAKLEPAQRVMFTSTYNAAALHDVAECLKSKDCTENEDSARDACYKPAAEKLVWLSP